MKQLVPREGGVLTGRTVAILLETDYVEPELHYYERRFAEEGATVRWLTPVVGPGLADLHRPRVRAAGDRRGRPGEDRRHHAGRVRRADRAFGHGLGPAALHRGRGPARPGGRPAAPRVRDAGRAQGHHLPRPVAGLADPGARTRPPGDLPRQPARRRAQHGRASTPTRTSSSTATWSPRAAPTTATCSPARSSTWSRRVRRATGAGGAARAEPATVPIGPRAAGAPTMTSPDFPFSDLVAAHVTGYDRRTRRGWTCAPATASRLRAELTPTTSAEFLRNLGDPYADATGARSTSCSTRAARCSPTASSTRTAAATPSRPSSIVFPGRAATRVRLRAAAAGGSASSRELARFYRRAQFGDGPRADFGDYRTVLRLGGDKSDQPRAGDRHDLPAGLRHGVGVPAHRRGGLPATWPSAAPSTCASTCGSSTGTRTSSTGTTGSTSGGGTEEKLFTSEFGDDYDAIPMYEQIYALAGPTQTYRVTGDPRIAEPTSRHAVRLFERFFRDPDARRLLLAHRPDPAQPAPRVARAQPRPQELELVGDHAPAYLINLFLATGDERHAAMLEETFDLIVEHFPDRAQPVRAGALPRRLVTRPTGTAGSRTAPWSGTTSRSPGT